RSRGTLEPDRRVYSSPRRNGLETTADGAGWAADDPDRDVSALDVPEAPLRARVRDALQGGRRFVYLAALLPDRGRRPGARPEHVDEADEAAGAGAAGGAQRRAAGVRG